MNKISKHIYRELFEDKIVKRNQELYRILYKRIWPCENYFKKFLCSIDSSVKLKYAKKILYYFNSLSDVLVPDFFVDEIISIQQHKLQRTAKYVPQDHLIHSINLYILGIYAFFNVEVFHRKILEQYVEKGLEKKITIFIREWKLFAIYHDIGYVLEGYVDEKGDVSNVGCINKYKDINRSLVYKHAVQAVAKIVLYTYIIDRSGEKFEFNENYISNSEWMYSGNNFLAESLCDMLKEYKEFVQLKLVHSEKDLGYVKWMLKDTNYLITYENELGIPLSYIFVDKDNNKQIAYSSGFKSYEEYLVKVKGVNAGSNNGGIICKYYVPNLDDKVKELVEIRYRNELFKYYKGAPVKIKNKISLASNPDAIEYIYITLCEWLFKCLGKYNPSKEYNEMDKLKEATKVAVTNVFAQHLEEDIKSVVEGDNATSQKITTLLKSLKSISSQEVDAKIREFYNEEFGTIAPIEKCYNTIHDNISTHFQETSKYINIFNEVIEFRPYEHDKNSIITEKICLKMQECAKKLNIKFEDLISYHTDYTLCDHGVVSSAILLQIIEFNEKVFRILNDNPILYLSYFDIDIIDKYDEEESITLYAQVLFSILLHNIYTKKSKAYGIEYKQDLDINAFSYFCALMDNLQRWGRPKQIDFSAVDLPEEHFLENDYDITFSDYNINIMCSSSFAGSMRKQINILEEYLPGASSIIKLYEKEI